MLGAIIGDIVGSRFEFNNHRSKDFDLFATGCFATDDSIMTLAVAKAIMETEKRIEPSVSGHGFGGGYYHLLSELTVKYMQEIGRQHPNCGYGGMFARWIFSDHPEPYNKHITHGDSSFVLLEYRQRVRKWQELAEIKKTPDMDYAAIESSRHRGMVFFVVSTGRHYLANHMTIKYKCCWVKGIYSLRRIT